LAKENLVSRPTKTLGLTGRKEWMLTETGIDESLTIKRVSHKQKPFLPIKSYEVQKIINNLIDAPRPENYVPFGDKKRKVVTKKETAIRTRSFRLAIIEAYDYRCAFCGMKIFSPDALLWEVEAAHIVPHGANGKDDVWNGVALCRLHHWAFDVGWFAIQENYKIVASQSINNVPLDYGRMDEYDFIRKPMQCESRMLLPQDNRMFPHPNATRWHRENIFHK